MDKLPLVSIIVPIYNTEDYLEKCINSLVQQSYEKIEIIAVDDGSLDESRQMIEKLAKGDNRIRVFHKKNGGLSSARNYGIKEARGEFICLVDSDDYVERDFVAVMLKGVLENKADITVVGFNDSLPKKQVVSGEEAAIGLLVGQENIDIVAWNKMYRKKMFTDNDIWYPEGQNYEDCLTTYKLLARAQTVSYVDESLYHYVNRAKSITKNDKKEEKLKVRELAAREAIEYFKKDKDLLEAAKVSLLLSKYAFLDFAISGVIDKKYKKEVLKWLKENVKNYKANKFVTSKLKMYNILSTKLGGIFYVLFRKIRHE